MSDPQKPSSLSWLNLIGVIAVGSFQLLSMWFGGDETPAPLPPPATWVITKDGEVIENAEDIVAMLSKREDGKYEGMGIPKSGKITLRGVAITSGSQPAPVPPTPVPPGPQPPPQPPAPQPETVQAKIANAATGIPASEREAVAAIYASVGGWIETKQIQTTDYGCTHLKQSLKKLNLQSPAWSKVWTIVNAESAESLEELRLLCTRVASGLRGAK